MEHAVYQQFYELERDHWWFRGMRTICRSQLARASQLNGRGRLRCLDIGCGTGLWTSELESLGTVWGLDVAPEALQHCRARGLRRLIRGLAERLPIADDSCDVVTALGVLEHVDDDAGLIDELARVCRPGGHVLLLTSAYRGLWSAHDEAVHHKRRYTRAELLRLLSRSEFEIVKLSYVNALLLPAIVGFRLAQRLFQRRCVERPSRSPDVFRVPGPLNHLLYACLWAESRWLRQANLPWGVGVLAVVRRTHEAGRRIEVGREDDACTTPQLIVR